MYNSTKLHRHQTKETLRRKYLEFKKLLSYPCLNIAEEAINHMFYVILYGVYLSYVMDFKSKKEEYQ